MKSQHEQTGLVIWKAVYCNEYLLNNQIVAVY